MERGFSRPPAVAGVTQPMVLRRADFVRQFDHVHLVANDSARQLNMLLAGLGSGQLYDTTARKHLDAGTLVQL